MLGNFLLQVDVLTNVVKIAVVSSDLFLLAGPAQGLQPKEEDRSRLCLKPNEPQPITGFAFGIPDMSSTWEMQV